MRDIGRIDLHMHSAVSDGTDSPAEILARVREAGLSVFALTDRVEGVMIRGSKYDVEDAELTNAFPLGVGNDFKTDISLDFCSGIAAVLLCDRGE